MQLLTQNKLLKFFLIFCYYYTKIFGLTTYNLDKKTLKVVPSKLSTAYGVFCHGLTILLIPIITCNYTKDIKFANESHLVIRVHVINTVFKFIAVIATFITRWRGQSELIELFDKTVELDKQFSGYEAYNISNQRLIFLLALKIITIIMETIIRPLIIFNLIPHPTLLATITWLYVINLSSILNAVITHYYSRILYISKFYDFLNWSLKQNVVKLKRIDSIYKCMMNKMSIKQEESSLAISFNNLAQLYTEIFKLATRTNNIFQFDFLVIITTRFTHTVSLLFFFYSLEKSDNSFNTQIGVYIIIDIILCFMDLFLLIYVCNMTMQNSVRPRNILQRSRDYWHSSKILENQTETLQLQLVRQELQLDICGMFLLNFELLWSMVAAIAMEFIILIQFENQPTA